MSKDEYESLILEKHKDKLYFDIQICKGVTLKDIDEEKVRWFLNKAKVERNLDIDPSVFSEEALRKLDLIANDKFTNAAILMFGKNPQRSFDYVNLLQGTISGDTALNDLKDMVKKGIISIKRKGRSSYYVIR